MKPRESGVIEGAAVGLAGVRRAVDLEARKGQKPRRFERAVRLRASRRAPTAGAAGRRRRRSQRTEHRRERFQSPHNSGRIGCVVIGDKLVDIPAAMDGNRMVRRRPESISAMQRPEFWPSEVGTIFPVAPGVYQRQSIVVDPGVTAPRGHRLGTLFPTCRRHAPPVTSIRPASFAPQHTHASKTFPSLGIEWCRSTQHRTCLFAGS